MAFFLLPAAGCLLVLLENLFNKGLKFLDGEFPDRRYWFQLMTYFTLVRPYLSSGFCVKMFRYYADHVATVNRRPYIHFLGVCPCP